MKTHFAEGTWKLERLMLGPELGEYALNKLEKPVTAQIKAGSRFLESTRGREGCDEQWETI